MTVPIPKIKGEDIGIRGHFITEAGVYTDPTSVTVKTEDPSGTVYTQTAVAESTGIHHGSHKTDQPGRWRMWIYGEDTFDVAGYLEFTVEDSPLT